MMKHVGALLAAAAMALGAQGAQAQPTSGADEDNTGIYCVYDWLVEDLSHELVAEAILFGDLEAAKMAEADTKLEAAADACADEFDFTEAKRTATADMGAYGVAIDYLSANLIDAGATEAIVERVFGIYDELTDEEIDLFLDPSWRNNAAFGDKLEGKLKAIGLPEDEFAISEAATILELSVLAEEAVFMFLVDDL